MFEHIVLFKTKKGILQEQKQEIIDSLKELTTHIPQIISLTTGHNISDRNQGLDIGLKVTFQEVADFHIYRDHPQHQKILEEIIRPNIEDVIAVDYDY